MNRTRWIFVGILALVIIIVGVSIIIRLVTGGPSAGPSDFVLERPNTLNIRVLTALPVEPWVRTAAETYNASAPTIDDIPIQVEIVAMDGLTALGRWDRNDFGALEAGADPESAAPEGFPTVWIPDNRYLVELANASYKERLGRDVFLTDGEYRARPIAISLFTWGIYESRAQVLTDHFGELSWKTIHDAAIAKGGWPESGRGSFLGLFQAGGPQPQQKRRGSDGDDCGSRRILRTPRHQRRGSHQC